MDSSLGDSSLLETTDTSLQENTLLVNDSTNIDVSDPTLTSDDLSALSNGTDNDLSESSLHANLNPDIEKSLSKFETELAEHASNIVDDAIDSASLSLRSSGDFSLLNDADSLKNKAVEKEIPIENGIEMPEESPQSEKKDEEKTDEWLDILGNGLVRKKVIEAGQGEKSRPERGQEVTIEIASFTEDDSSLDPKKKISFIIADFDVAEGIDMAVNLMEKGEKCKLECDAKYCQPKAGQKNNIPKEGKIIFHIELLDIEDGPYNISVPIEKRLNWIETKRKLGNELYTKNLLEEAQRAYTKCNRVLRQASNQEHSQENKVKIDDFTIKCHNNLAATLIKLHNWKDALQACLVAEKMDGNNIKTLFRKGTICAKLGQLKQSITALKKANSLSPDDKTIQKELAKQQRRLDEQTKAQKLMYKRMMGVAKDNDPKPDKARRPWYSSSMLVGSSLLAVGTAVLIGLYMMHR